MGNQGFQIINSSAYAWSSGELVPVIGRIVDDFSPDTLILFLGNNEWFHWQPKPQPWSGRSRQEILEVASHSRAASAVIFSAFKIQQRQLRSGQQNSHSAESPEFIGFSHALRHPLNRSEFDPQQWIETKENYLDVFRENLQMMIRSANNAGVRTIVLTVPFNYKLSPSWKHPQPESFDARYEKTVKENIKKSADLIENKQYKKSLQILNSRIALDPLPPILHYLKGYCFEALKKNEAAEDAYAECRENMIENLGSRLSINRMIREVARANGAILLDVKKLFDEHQHARQRYFNVDLIHDDCHPNVEGHRIIAEALIPLLEEPWKMP